MYNRAYNVLLQTYNIVGGKNPDVRIYSLSWAASHTCTAGPWDKLCPRSKRRAVAVRHL